MGFAEKDKRRGSAFRAETEKVIARWLGTVELREPIVDLGGRGKGRGWLQGLVEQEFETWDLQEGRTVSRVIDAQNMVGVEDGSIGTIICIATLEHIEAPWLAAKEIARVIFPGGRLFVVAPFSYVFHEAPADYWRFTPDGLRVLFGEAFRESYCDWLDGGPQQVGVVFDGIRRGPAS